MGKQNPTGPTEIVDIGNVFLFSIFGDSLCDACHACGVSSNLTYKSL